jgi:hypothetical protein
MKPLIFRDFGGVVDQIQGETEAAAHFDGLSAGLDYKTPS